MVNEQPREFSAEFKFEVVMEALQAKKDAVDICLKFNISEAQLVRLIQEFLREELALFETAPIVL